jgi:hypothetical protein
MKQRSQRIEVLHWVSNVAPARGAWIETSKP